MSNDTNLELANLEELLKIQRTFVHDLASSVSIAQGMLEIVIVTLEKDSEKNALEIQRLKKSLSALERTGTLIVANRQIVNFAPTKI